MGVTPYVTMAAPIGGGRGGRGISIGIVEGGWVCTIGMGVIPYMAMAGVPGPVAAGRLLCLG